MENSRLVLVGCTAICTLLIASVLGHINFFGVVATAAQDSPTKEEFEKLKAEVTRINGLEEQNLGLINNFDKRYDAETKRIDTRLTQSEFKFAGIGDIVASALTLEQFRKVRGDNDLAKPQWVQCNGADKEANYAYSTSQYAKDSRRNNVPDLVGRYPRGYDGKPELPLLKTLEDAIVDHHHFLDGGKTTYGWEVMGDAQGGGNNQVARWRNTVNRFGTSGVIAVGGVRVDASETRPKTTIVNFFIRIN